MTFLAILVLISLAWLAPMLFIINMERVDKTEKMFWLLAVLPFSWFAALALLMSGPVLSGHGPQNYR